MYSEKTRAGLGVARWALALMSCVVMALPASAHEGGHSHSHQAGAAATSVEAPSAEADGVRIRLVAPTATGEWGLRIDNTGSRSIRLAADVRLLRLAIEPPSGENTRRGKSRETVCDGPRDFGLRNSFPAGRSLTLKPGFSYAERFDPRLLCFGAKAKKLVAGARVRASYGFRAKPKWQRGPARPPFAVEFEGSGKERTSFRGIRAPAVVLTAEVGEATAALLEGFPAPQAGLVPPAFPARKRHAGAKGSKGATSAKKVRRAPRLTLTTSRHADASVKRELRLSVQAHNAGPRPVLVALRARQLVFFVAGPNGIKRCNRSGRHQVPRDLLRRLKEGKHIHVDVLLGESCPNVGFKRPGLYRARPLMYAIEANDDSAPRLVRQRVSVKAPGEVGGTHHIDDDATLIRIRIGSRSLYATAPSAVATASLSD